MSAGGELNRGYEGPWNNGGESIALMEGVVLVHSMCLKFFKGLCDQMLVHHHFKSLLIT